MRSLDNGFNFNSIKVRLKHGDFSLNSLQNSNFNSIKVRLKHIFIVSSLLSVFVFQFHKGTIKTHCFWIYNILIFNRIYDCKVKKSY